VRDYRQDLYPLGNTAHFQSSCVYPCFWKGLNYLFFLFTTLLASSFCYNMIYFQTQNNLGFSWIVEYL
jgi:hypothetical protein